MAKSVKKSKMTLDKLAWTTQGEFLGVRRDISELRGDVEDGFSAVRKDMGEGFLAMRKDITEGVRDIVREGNVEIIASNEKVASKLDEFYTHWSGYKGRNGYKMIVDFRSIYWPGQVLK